MFHSCHSNRGSCELLGEIELTEISDLSSLLARSRQAFSGWSRLALKERISYLTAFLKEYTQQREVIATFIAREIGQAYTHVIAAVDQDIVFIQRYLDNAETILSPEILLQDATTLHTAYYDPKGVIVAISPWNFPSTMFVRLAVIPLLAGNTVIHKPATACMWSGKHLIDMITKILPEDVLIPVYGESDLGNELTKLPVDMILFTGSTKVGQIISENAAPNLVHPHLELGGSAPAIILPGTDINQAMMEFIEYFRIRYTGQICDGMKRFFVHSSQYEVFIQALHQYFGTMAIGNPLSKETRMGCLVSQEAKNNILSAVDQSVVMGAKRRDLGVIENVDGPFLPLILLTEVTLDMPVMTQEVFGPVIPVMKYETIDEVITYANATKYGLGGYLRGKNNEEINYVCSRLRTGNIAVNNTSYCNLPQLPFGGYTPASGNFREHGIVGLRGYTEMKVVSKGRM